jgi:hypothetical protein
LPAEDDTVDPPPAPPSPPPLELAVADAASRVEVELTTLLVVASGEPLEAVVWLEEEVPVEGLLLLPHAATSATPRTVPAAATRREG